MLLSMSIGGVALYTMLSVYKKRQQKNSFHKKTSKITHSALVAQRQQITDISSSAESKQNHNTEKELNQDITIATASLGLAAAGHIYLPLGLISLVGNIYLTIPSIRVAYTALKNKGVNIDTLSVITMSIGLAMHYYVWCSIANILYVISKKLLLKIKDDSQKSLVDVFKNRPQTVWVLMDNIEIQQPFEALKTGNVIIVSAGETIPADGYVTKGMASIDQHILTGESQPVEKGIDDEVFASTIVLIGKVYITVLKTGEETTVEKIGELLNQTAHFKTSLQLKAENLTDKTVLPTLVVGIFALPFIGLMGAAALLNAHFGYRMLVIAPIGILNFFQIMSKKGILVKDGRILEFLGEVDTLVFDKTGTLTENQPQVSHIHTVDGYKENEILMIAASAEYKQTHPVALAILKEAKERELVPMNTESLSYAVGYGIKVLFEEKIVRVGSLRFMEIEDIPIPLNLRDTIEQGHKEGNSVISVAIDDTLAGVIELIPSVRPEAKETIKTLKEQSIKSVYIISGDHEQPTRKLANSLGIDGYFAETLPEDKAKIIKKLQASGKKVCYVGDGVNDVIALKQANVSVSLRGASAAATDTAQVILMHEKLDQLCELFKIAQAFEKNMKNSFIAILTPSLIAGFGAFFLHFTIIQTIILKQVGLFAGLSNTMLPLVEDRSINNKSNASCSCGSNRKYKKCCCN